MPHTIVIADDVTGANDIGIMYAKAGLTTYVYSYGAGEPHSYPPCDCLVIDTDSRFDPAKRAYEKVTDAIRNVPKEGVCQYIDKQCSVFRGNIGAEFDAMLDELGEEFAVVVLGFPDNKRQTLHGIHYVHGVKLEDSQFRNDPVHPMKQSSLKEILQGQTKRRVDNIFYEAYEEGVLTVKALLEEKRKSGGYCIMDVRDNADLAFLAEVLEKERVICGSSALSAYLAKREAQRTNRTAPVRKAKTGKIFCMAGSLTPQTAAQTSYMKKKGYPVIVLDTRRLFDDEEREAQQNDIWQQICRAYESGEFCMLCAANDPLVVAQTKRLGAQKGMDNTAVSSLVSAELSGLSKRAIDAFFIRRIIVCGGDTSAALCAQLKIRGMKVLEEIEAGLPTCESVDAPHYRMVLKSGSFGSEEFVEKAAQTLLLE